MSRTFKDLNGREWPVIVDGDAIARVKDATGILLTDLVSTAVAAQIAADPLMVMSILYAICRPDAEGRSVASESDFRKLINGDALEDGAEALIEGVLSFFPKSRRKLMQAIVSKGRAVQELAASKAMKELDRLTPESILEKATRETAAKMVPGPASPLDNSPGGGSGSSLESSASAPAD